jgi:hypothetical protein
MNATKQQARWEYFGPHSREVCDSNGRAVCKVAASAPDNTGPFIAAAPDLYAALDDLMGSAPDMALEDGDIICRHCGRSYCPDDAPKDAAECSDDCPGYTARAALARARGEVR